MKTTTELKMRTTSPEWQQFLWFVTERAAIAHRRYVLKAPRPWTEDKIMQEGKFGNVWREIDRGTEWELYRLRTAQAPREQVALILCYRHNLIPATTLALLGGATPLDIANDSRGSAVFSDVIKIYPHLDTLCPSGACGSEAVRMATYAYVHWSHVVDRLDEYMYKIGSNVNDPYYVHRLTQATFPLLGEFKSYEVMTSLTYCDWWPHDEDSFMHAGHGAMPALRLLTGDTETADELMSAYLVPLKDIVRPLLEAAGMHWLVPKFTYRTLEDCLCEWRKWRAVSEGKRVNRPWPDGLGRFNEGA